MSDQGIQAGPGPVAPTPLWKTPWAIGGAVVVALLIGYQLAQRPQPPPADPKPWVGPKIDPAPQPTPPVPLVSPVVTATPVVQPLPPPPVTPVAPPVEPQPPPVQPIPEPLPQPPPAQPVAEPPLQPAPHAGVRYPVLQPWDEALPLLEQVLKPDGNSEVFFAITDDGFTHVANIQVPNHWDQGEARARVLNSNGVVLSEGLGRYRLTQNSYGVMRSIQPVWLINDAGARDVCLAFIVPKGSETVYVNESRLCVMEPDCGKPIVCGRFK